MRFVKRLMRGSRSPLSGGLRMPSPTLVILKAISHWKRKRVFISSDSNVEVIPPPYSGPTPTSPIYLFLESSS